MIDKILFRFPKFSRQSIHESEELTALDLAGKTAQKVNECIEVTNTVDGRINEKEDKEHLSKNRKLSASGNFTGTLSGRGLISVFTDINDSLSLAKTLIKKVNDRESIGAIYDGGLFPQDDPPSYDIEGGLF